MKLDHVTYQVPAGHLVDASLDEFFKLLEMQEIKPDDEVEKDWNVRWFQDKDGFQIHLVDAAEDAAGFVDLKLGHFCAILSREGYAAATSSIYLERNSRQSPRAWLRHAGTGLRVEIRPKSLTMVDNPHIDASAINWGKLQSLDPPSEDRIKAVLLEAHEIYVRRNAQHKDSWRREGLRGALFNLRRKVERAWDYLFNADFDFTESRDYDEDDLLDVINYAAIAVLAKREGNRDGKGTWWND
jgi:hypothetical protein